MAVALYGAGLLYTVYALLRRRGEVFAPVLAAFSVGVILHGVSLIETAVHLGAIPANNFLQSISLCGFLLALVFLFVNWRYEFQSLSVVVFPLVFVMALIGSMEHPVAGWTDRTLRGAWLTVHVVLVLLGYAALLLTAAASVFYLVHERRLKNKKPVRWFNRLPPLGTLDDILSRSMTIGFVLITLGVITGALWAFIESGSRWISDPKIPVSLITWFTYVVMIFLRVSAGWRGRRAAVMAITVLGCSAATWMVHFVR